MTFKPFIKSVVRAGLIGASVYMLAGAPSVQAQETTTYTYDALGRVTGVAHSGGPSSGTNANYQYDAAGNRTQVVVTGSPNGSAGSSDSGSGASVGQVVYVVVPLNGFTLIPIRR